MEAGPIRSLPAVAVKQQPDVFWHRNRAGITDKFSVVQPRSQPVVAMVMGRIKKKFPLNGRTTSEPNEPEGEGEKEQEGFLHVHRELTRVVTGDSTGPWGGRVFPVGLRHTQ